jgi:hypothetical protein
MLVVALALSLVVGACNDDDDAATTEATTATTAAETTTTVAATTTTEAPPPPPPEEPAVAVPFLEAWQGSGHADATAEAFRHWDEDDPAVVPQFCAKCHSAGGFEDFLGLDGSEAGTVDADHSIDTVISCTTCHNTATQALNSVVMPSGIEITGLGSEAVCMNCHQGRQSKMSVDEAITAAGVDDDVVSEDLGFLNIHYYAAAATKYGTEAMGGYEYEGSSYDAFFVHVEGYETCADCHDSHTLELKLDECAVCHTGVASVEDVRAIRMAGSLVDYDGDGSMDEGIADEIAGLQEQLYAAIQAYAADVVAAPLVYDSHAYPYFFIDTDGNGAVDEGEAIYPNQYASWTPRLLRAAYNYQVSLKDPGGYAHGGKYIIQLLSDSLADINSVLPTPMALDALHRIDHGHFAGSEEAFRHWDGEEDMGLVAGSCSRCHTADGLPLYLTEGVEITQSASNGFLCSTCHTDLETYAIFEAGPVTFPSGLTVDTGDSGNLCMNCHQGRASTASVDAATAGFDPDAVSEDLRFLNVHYFAAGASLFGNEAQGAYQYAGSEYLGRNAHVENFDTCTECHGTHTLEVKVNDCGTCHGGVATMADLAGIRIGETDWDGDGDVTEGIAGEIETMEEMLFSAIQDYAANTAGVAIIYDSHAYPYFFIDTDGNGVSDPGEAIFPNQYNAWTSRLLKAAYNYQYAQKDPGGYAHGGLYILQVLYDSLVDLGVDTSAMTRP